MENQTSLPDVFDSLVAICKFIAVPKMEPEFHRKHYHAVEMSNAFIKLLVAHHPRLEAPFRKSPVSISEGAEALRQVIPTLGLNEEEVAWLDDQLTEILKVLVPVVRDPALPHWLTECKWAIEGAFQ